MATIGGLTWDAVGQHYYNTGIDGVALFVWDNNADTTPAATNKRGWYKCAAAWEGVTAVNESPSGAESNKQYADNIEYLNLISKEEFGLTIECFQTPVAFDECDGSITLTANDSPIAGLRLHGQTRKTFGLVYRVQKGSDTEAAGKLGYVYHVVYGCKAAPSSRDNATVNESPEAQTLSYEISTSSLTNQYIDPTTSAAMSASNTIFGEFYQSVKELVHISIDTTGFTAQQISALWTVLYPAVGGNMPTPQSILNVLPSV